VGCFPFCRVPPDPAHGKGWNLCRVPRSGPRQRAEAGPVGTDHFVVCLDPAHGKGFAVGLWHGTRQRSRWPCVLSCAHGKQFQIFEFNFRNVFFSIFSFNRFGILFHVSNFITFSHYIAKMIKQFMFYCNIVIISCV